VIIYCLFYYIMVLHIRCIKDIDIFIIIRAFFKIISKKYFISLKINKKYVEKKKGKRLKESRRSEFQISAFTRRTNAPTIRFNLRQFILTMPSVILFLTTFRPLLRNRNNNFRSLSCEFSCERYIFPIDLVSSNSICV